MPRTVTIPGYGDTEFPDSMSDQEVSAVAKKFYDKANAPSSPGAANYKDPINTNPPNQVQPAVGVAANAANGEDHPESGWRTLSKMGGATLGGIGGALGGGPIGVAAGMAAGYGAGGRVYDKIADDKPLIRSGDTHTAGTMGGMTVGGALGGPLGAAAGSAAGGAFADSLDGKTPDLKTAGTDAAEGGIGHFIGGADSALKAAMADPSHALGAGVAGFKQFFTGKPDLGISEKAVVDANPNTANDRQAISTLAPQDTAHFAESAANGNAILPTQMKANEALRMGGQKALDQRLGDIKGQQDHIKSTLGGNGKEGLVPGGDAPLPKVEPAQPVPGPIPPPGYAKDTLQGISPEEARQAAFYGRDPAPPDPKGGSWLSPEDATAIYSKQPRDPLQNLDMPEARNLTNQQRRILGDKDVPQSPFNAAKTANTRIPAGHVVPDFQPPNADLPPHVVRGMQDAVHQGNVEKQGILDNDPKKILEQQARTREAGQRDLLASTVDENQKNEQARIQLQNILKGLDTREQSLTRLGAQPQQDAALHLPLFGHSPTVIGARIMSDPRITLPNSTLFGLRPETPIRSDALRSDRIFNPTGGMLREPVGNQETDPVRGLLGSYLADHPSDALPDRKKKER